jgi:hypothetical protein
LSNSSRCQCSSSNQSCQILQVFHDSPLRDLKAADHAAIQGIQGANTITLDLLCHIYLVRPASANAQSESSKVVLQVSHNQRVPRKA